MKLSRFLLFHKNRQIKIIYNRGMQASEQLLNIHHDQRQLYPLPSWPIPHNNESGHYDDDDDVVVGNDE